MKKVAVVGGGAMGGVWAGHLATGGASVSVVDVSNDVIAAIMASGLTVESGDRIISPRVRATTKAGELEPQDVVFVFVKGPHTRASCESVQSLLGPASTVVTLQNGWGNADVLAEVVPADRLVIGVTYEGATLRAPGIVAHTGRGPTFVGPYRDGDSLELAELVATIMRDGGFECRATLGVKTEIWRKLVHNAACLPVSALTGFRASELVDPGPVWDLLQQLALETVDVAEAMGYEIDRAERVQHIHTVLSGAGMGTPSMLADVIAKKQTEIDLINGAVVSAGDHHGVPVPLNRAMVALIKGLEASWSRVI